ncbi:MAG: D-2-hydroxyacid dehydrogenase [Gammaproteobacteria bacterium]|nr:D-2-hydroxyacid dehydrogenase [Gammaproteobacteria bacterium]
MDEQVLIFNRDAPWFAQQLEQQLAGFRYQAAETETDALDKAADTTILVALAPQISDELLAATANLKWIHALTSGVDNLLQSTELSEQVVLSNSGGFHGPQMAELTFLLMLSALRDYPRMLNNQQACKWERWPQPLLCEKTVCIVGLGAIAEALAVRCQAFGMRITGVSDGRASMDRVDKIYPRNALCEAASECDFLVVLVPYSPATHHLIDDEVFRAMGEHAILVNVARGGCVDETALKEHLDKGSIRAAGIDVFETEPLPENNPLWKTERALITPHIGGMSDNYPQQVLPVVLEHLTAWQAGGAAALPARIDRGS